MSFFFISASTRGRNLRGRRVFPEGLLPIASHGTRKNEGSRALYVEARVHNGSTPRTRCIATRGRAVRRRKSAYDRATGDHAFVRRVRWGGTDGLRKGTAERLLSFPTFVVPAYAPPSRDATAASLGRGGIRIYDTGGGRGRPSIPRVTSKKYKLLPEYGTARAKWTDGYRRMD